MNEYERILGIVRAKNQTSIELNPLGTALVVVDMQRYYTQPSFPFTEICEKLSPGSSVGYLNRVRETVSRTTRRSRFSADSPTAGSSSWATPTAANEKPA